MEAANNIIDMLSKKLEVYQKFVETLAPSLNLMQGSSTASSVPTQGSSTASSLPTQGSSTPTPTVAPTQLVYKPSERYTKVEKILALMNLKKNEYNNLLVNNKKKRLKFIFYRIIKITFIIF